MSDRTGFANGTLKAIIYFENKDGRVIMPPEEIGANISYAKMMYERKYKAEGWEWREAGTLPDVDRLQRRLVEQEKRRAEQMGIVDDQMRSMIFARTGDSLRARMCGSDTTPFEKDFISHYLMMRDDKRSKYQHALTAHNWFIDARENDSSTKIEDRLPLEKGQFER